MAVDLTTGTYDESGMFSFYHENPKEINQNDNNKLSLSKFCVEKVLKKSSQEKTIVFKGHFPEDGKPSIVKIERNPFDSRDLPKLFSTTKVELKFRNNIYANYDVKLQNVLNETSIQVIHPASDQDFERYCETPLIMINETVHMYKTIIEPHMKEKFLQKAKKETCEPGEDILLETDEFILKREGLEHCKCSSLHFVAKAFLKNSDLLSLRDLTSSHVPLLTRLKTSCVDALRAKYGKCGIESYIFHPPPSSPLCVVFSSVAEKDDLVPCESAHHLDLVLDNLRLIPEYYRKATLEYSLPEHSQLAKDIAALDL